MKLCPKCNKQFSDDANFCPVDAARLVAMQAAADGSDALTARFELRDRLGGSRTGAVHRATDKQTGAAVAVKLVEPRVVALPGVAQRLERELKQLERVHSAGVAKLIASGKRGDDTWIAMELLEGAQTLDEAITARGPIAVDQASQLIEVIGEALIEAAQVGVVHRDLAPKNVLFAGSEVKLVNFSLPVPTTERVPGVPEFVAPEQVEGKPVDQRSNLYSLGALYYFVLTGQTVHAGTPEEVHRAHTAAAIRTPSSLAAVPAPVEAVILRALDRSPTKRFLTVRQFVDEVGRVARGEAARTTQPLGKVKPKAELVQTLLGVRSGPAPAPAPALVPAPPVLPGQPVAVAPAPSMASTQIGMPPGLSEAAPTAQPFQQPAAPTTPTHLKAPPMEAPMAVATSLPAPVAPAPQPGVAERSPWAPPTGDSPAAAQPAELLGHPPIQIEPVPATPAAPAPAAPAPEPEPAPAPVVPAAPVIAPPQVSNAPSKRKPAEEKDKGKFRETMWFKKGELDAQAAQVAAEEAAKTGKAVAGDRADSLPIDERYKDDGSITRSDKEKYSLRTGATQMMRAMKDDPGATGGNSRVSEDALITEMKGGRQVILIAIGVGVVALIVLIAVFALT
jgi:eukaryotic-like serine/threonine-protein kinase